MWKLQRELVIRIKIILFVAIGKYSKAIGEIVLTLRIYENKIHTSEQYNRGDIMQ